MDDLTFLLRLLWIPSGTSVDHAFEVGVLRSRGLPLTESLAWNHWCKLSAPEAEFGDAELLFVTDQDEPRPLPTGVEFVLMMSFTGGGARLGAEHFYDWRALSQQEAESVCREIWLGELVEMARAARQLVQLPRSSTLQ